MIDNDREKFAAQLIGLQHIFRPDKQLSNELVETYWQVFKGWELKDFIKACQGVLTSKTIPTFPLPGEIIQAFNDPIQNVLAWELALSIASKHGTWSNITFEDYGIHRTIEAMGGWVQFCNCPEKERPFKQKEFERLYQHFKTVSPPENVAPLLGVNDDIPENHVIIPLKGKLKEIE